VQKKWELATAGPDCGGPASLDSVP
jgi:hypothetical protein